MADFRLVFDRAPENALASRRAGAGLALSGGGFRAMLFHVGTLRRLFEIGALQNVDRVSSVSGGSITAAVMALAWPQLAAAPVDVATFEREVQRPLFDFASKRIDVFAGLGGLLIPGRSIAQSVAKRFDKLFDRATLEALPDHPRFVFCATNLGSGSLVRFAKTYTADYRIGKRDGLVLPLGQVVAASAAFPPVLSPMVIKLSRDQELTQQFNTESAEAPPLANQAPYIRRLELSDGGVYDNLGLQPVERFHTLLVSDGGGPFQYEPSVPKNWLNHMIRAWKVTDNQVRALRRSGLIDEYQASERFGSFWGIQTTYSDYAKRRIPVHDAWAGVLKAVPTRLWPIEPLRRKQLINWAYALTDAAVRTHVTDDIDEPALPYADAPLDAAPPAARKP